MRTVVLGMLLLAAPGFGAAGVTVTADFVSEYVFRGVSQRQGVSIQPTIGYAILDNLRAALWANLRLEDSIALSETNYSLQWTTLTASPASLTIGAIHYDRGSSLPAPETSEIFGGVDLRLPGSPSLYLFYDFDASPGAYLELSAAHSFLLPDYRGTIDVGGAAGYDLGRIDGFQDARLSVGFTRHLGDWRLQPSLDLHFPATAVDPAANNFRPVFRFSASRSF